ncbi:molybdopterin-dependent oxidoreductase [Gemmobacter fulvus]|uniref:xanthine dehydrogenase family protein molybdopterin-binding subunit n=1 Tax=Gemmobacter fulvus TaxID=2840474 RepID=UPI0027965C82|nr:molybdopterin cofactor-binding domain-containing protein [Gemmobacter fulvus]MDQ1850181.1 molybdopterin-dependent oxidoreductase [Gemmobacter fulvus]
MTEFAYVGKRLTKPDIYGKVTGEAKYTDDMTVPGMVEGRILASPHAHARILRIDTSKAAALPGVLCVLTHKDCPDSRFSRSTMAEALPEFAFTGERQDQYILTDKARYVGDWIAAVAAEDIYTAEAALELIEVEYELLPMILDPHKALEPGAPSVHDDVAGNIAFEMDHPFNSGDVDRAFAEAEAVVEFTGVNSRQKHLHLETDIAIAYHESDGRLVIISPSQGPHLAKKHLTKRVFPDLSDGDIRWLSPTIGGGFGARLALGVEPVAVLLARACKRPVRVTTTREEDFSGYSSRTDQHQTIRVAANKDGKLLAIEQIIVADSGAYLSHSATTATVNMQKTLGVLKCDNIRGHLTVAYTNTPTTSGFRGYGNPEGAFVFQQALDRLAEKIGMDPMEFRLKNLKVPGDPSCFVPVPLEHTKLEECIHLAAEKIGYKDKWQGWGVAKPGRYKRGIGMSVLTHASGAGGFLLEHSSCVMKVLSDGALNLIVSPCEMGQGIIGALAQVAAESSGLRYEQIRVSTGDTDVTMFDIGSHASRSMLVIGNAVAAAGVKIKEQIRDRAVALFAEHQVRVTPDQIEVRAGRITSDAAPGVAFDVAQVAYAAIYDFGSGGSQLNASGSYLSTSHHPNHQAAFAEVEVDTETGLVTVLNYVSAHDIGRAINPLLVEAQMEGSLVQGIGFALTEDFVIDPDTGRVLSDSLLTYRLPTTMDVPDMAHLLVEDPLEAGPFGAKGCGEAGLVNPAPAIANAIYDAIGVRIHSLPMAADKVLWALRHGEGAAPGGSRVSGQYL